MLSPVTTNFLSLYNFRKRTMADASNFFSILQEIKHIGYHYSSVVHKGVKGILKEDDHFTCKRILNYIHHTEGIRHTYDFKIGEREVILHFVDYDKTEREVFNNYTKIVIMMLYLLSYDSSTNILCTRKLSIYVYLTPYKKYLPKNRRSPISPTHANSGVTFSCIENNHIGIYRKEEWFKTLTHECLHAIGVDINITNGLPRLHTHSTILVREGYVEFWAIFINSMISAYVIAHNDEKRFCRLLTDFLDAERRFILIQANKLLWHMAMRYKGFFRRDNHYKERTNAFAYLFITSYLFVNYKSFINECGSNNVNMVYVSNDMFIKDYIVKMFDSDEYIAALQKYDLPYLDDSLRRSIIELE